MRGSSLKQVETVAERLGPQLRAEVAFLGGATIELLLTDPAVDEVRVTKDVDVITVGRSRASFLVGFADRLRARGFRAGGQGALMSHDVGDIIALVDGRNELSTLPFEGGRADVVIERLRVIATGSEQSQTSARPK